VFCDASYNFVYEEGFVHARPGLSAPEVRVARCRGRVTTLLGDRVLELIVMLTLVSRTIAPSLRRFPTLSRSSLAFQRTMSGFKQVRTQKQRQIGDVHDTLCRHRISELDFSMAKHPAITHNLAVQVARYPRSHRDCR